MAKKNFIVTSSDITTSLAGTSDPKPITANDATERTVKRIMDEKNELQGQKPTGKNKGLKVGEERVSFVLLEGMYEKLQSMAHWDRKTLKDTVIDIFEDAFNQYETKNGAIQPKPPKRR